VRLEYALKLNNRLTAAAAGVGTWPGEALENPTVLRWRWQPVLTMGLASVFLLLAGAFVPITPPQKQTAFQGVKPPDLEQLESWVEALEETKLVEEKALEELQKEVEQLTDRPPDEWYSQPSLEASAHLKDQMQNQMKSLQKDLQTAENSLEKMGQRAESLTESQMDQLSGKLADALKSAQMGQLSLSAHLFENMPEIDPAKLKSISPEQAKKMMERLKNARAELASVQGDGDPVEALLMGEGEGEIPAGGGVSRGPGTVPLTLNPHPSEVGSTKIEGMSNENLERASLGETVGVSNGAHDELTPSGGRVAGGSAAQGTGGEAAWVNRLTPAEQAQVKAFFK